MDDNSRFRRDNDPPFSTLDTRFHGESQIAGPSTSSSERYRNTAMIATPMNDRGAVAATTYSGYYQDPALSTTTVQYQSTGYTPDQRQQHSFATYNPDILYSSSHVFDTNPPFQPRQPASMQLSGMMTPYFEPGSAGRLSALHSQHQQDQSNRASLLQQTYPTNLPIPGAARSDTVEGNEELQEPGVGMEAAYTAYQRALQEIFRNITATHLREASQSLLQISEWLLEHVAELRLNVDDESLFQDRLRLWNEFNAAWLALFNKQKEMLQSGDRLHHSYNIMTQSMINKMAGELIRLCDGVERHGLVDYQFGVAEEAVITVLTECLDLQESLEGVEEATDQQSGASRAPP